MEEKAGPGPVQPSSSILPSLQINMQGFMPLRAASSSGVDVGRGPRPARDQGMRVNGWWRQARPTSARWKTTSWPPLKQREPDNHPQRCMDGQTQARQASQRILFLFSPRATIFATLPGPWSWRGFHQQTPGAGGDRPLEPCRGQEPQGSSATLHQKD